MSSSNTEITIYDNNDAKIPIHLLKKVILTRIHHETFYLRISIEEDGKDRITNLSETETEV